MLDKDLVKLLMKEHGWKLDRINGSHYILVKDSKTVSVPVHGKDVKPGLLHSILKSAGLK
jgi:predicted RNA binding protein YcfA (HicA-like mRNA interferase family)